MKTRHPLGRSSAGMRLACGVGVATVDLTGVRAEFYEYEACGLEHNHLHGSPILERAKLGHC